MAAIPRDSASIAMDFDDDGSEINQEERKYVIPDSFVDKLNSNLKISRVFSLNDSKIALPEMAGFLHKKSPAIFRGWQKRYIELKDGHLRWYKIVK